MAHQSGQGARQLGGEELDGAKLVRAREFVESRKQFGEFHEDSVSDCGMVANHVPRASSFWILPMISAMRCSFFRMSAASWMAASSNNVPLGTTTTAR